MKENLRIDDHTEIDELVNKSSQAQKAIDEFTQEQIDSIVAGMAKSACEQSELLARMALEETGFGRYEDKVIKNRIACREVYRYIRDMKTVGVIKRDEKKMIAEVASPVGVILAIIPSTNPTSTAIYKALISLKSRNSVIFSPHPSAAGCIRKTADILHDAAVRAGAPKDIISCLDKPTLEATTYLMQHPKTALILATGGIGLVRAAYSSGKPAYGVGPGNVPAYIDRSADVAEAVRSILIGKTFDWGTVCSSEQAMVVDKPIVEQVKTELNRRKAYMCNEDQVKLLEKTVVTDKLTANPDIVGKSPCYIAQKAGFSVPDDTTALVAPYRGAGKDFPLSIEKLSPVICFYEVDGWQEGCKRCIEILSFGGLGHTISIHCTDEMIIKEFALKKPASRILVNTSSTHGAVGVTTNLPPSLTLGCGPLGGNITTDNITPLHLLTIKRVAYGIKRPTSTLAILDKDDSRMSEEKKSLPACTEDKPDKKERIAQIIDSIIIARSQKRMKDTDAGMTTKEDRIEKEAGAAAVDFVSEQDVRDAMKNGSKIKISKMTIITPLAKELGKSYGIFEEI